MIFVSNLRKGVSMGFYIEMIGVGEGDSFLLTLDHPDGKERYILIDGGDGERSDRVISHINKYANGFIGLMIGTHLDDDHLGGLIDVIESGIGVGVLILNTPGSFAKWLQMREVFKSFTKVESIRKIEKSVQATNDLLEVSKKHGITVETAVAGKSWSVDNVQLNVLNPTTERLENAWAEKILTDISTLSKSAIQRYLVEKGEAAPPTSHGNDASIIIELVFNGNNYALFPSDAGAGVIKEITAKKSYQFLKVPHHGSKTGLDEDLIKQLKSQTAFIPVGENSYGHPSLEILELLRKNGATTYCSEKTIDCRKECKAHDFTVLCHMEGKPGRPNWSTVDPKDCKNN
jgi:competence protein ComEC